MPHRPKKIKKSESKSATPGNQLAAQLAAQRRADMATRSTLSRFQNRKSEKK